MYSFSLTSALSLNWLQRLRFSIAVFPIRISGFPTTVPTEFSHISMNNDPTSTKRLQLYPFCPLSEFNDSLTFGCSCTAGSQQTHKYVFLLFIV